MSTTIRTICTECGMDCEPALEDLSLELSPDGSGEGSSYSFDCPLCNQSVTHPANRRVVGILLAIGVAYRIGKQSYPLLTEIDIENFVEQLDDDPSAWSAELNVQ